MLIPATEESLSVGRLIEIYVTMTGFQQKGLFDLVSGGSDGYRFKKVANLLADRSGRPTRELLLEIARRLRLT